MKSLLIALALLAASPQEDCDMSAPVRYPGAVSAKNSQVRANALQAGAYALPPAWSSDRPRTIDDVFCTEGNLVLGNPNTAHVSRLKRTNNAPVIVTGWAGNLGNNSGADAVMGSAVYEVRGAPNADRVSGGLFLVPGSTHFEIVANGAYYAGGGGSFDVVFQLDSDKEYAFAFYSTTVQILDAVYFAVPAALVAGVGSAAMPQFAFTQSSGWPSHVRFNRNDPGVPGDSFLQYGSAAILQFSLNVEGKIVTIF